MTRVTYGIGTAEFGNLRSQDNGITEFGTAKLRNSATAINRGP